MYDNRTNKPAVLVILNFLVKNKLENYRYEQRMEGFINPPSVASRTSRHRFAEISALFSPSYP